MHLYVTRGEEHCTALSFKPLKGLRIKCCQPLLIQHAAMHCRGMVVMVEKFNVHVAKSCFVKYFYQDKLTSKVLAHVSVSVAV